ncbi:MAG: hypothetical protein L0Y68_00975 [Candidatus Dadabacteria bacterium]|nr:hypothetical protein [Candidatus Dadabacteria bacterium]
MKRIITALVIVMGLTFGMFSFSIETHLTPQAVACDDKGKDTTKDNGGNTESGYNPLLRFI